MYEFSLQVANIYLFRRSWWLLLPPIVQPIILFSAKYSCGRCLELIYCLLACVFFLQNKYLRDQYIDYDIILLKKTLCHPIIHTGRGEAQLFDAIWVLLQGSQCKVRRIGVGVSGLITNLLMNGGSS